MCHQQSSIFHNRVLIHVNNNQKLNQLLLEIIADIGYFILLVNVILFSKGFSSKGKAFRIFTCYLIIMFVIQITVSVFQYFRMNNLFLSHFYFILQFILLSYFYLNLGLNKAQSLTVKAGFVFCLSLLAIQYYNDSSQLLKFNLFEIFITSFLLIIYATFYLYNLLTDKKEFYYLNLGVLIYLFGSTVLFLAGDLLTLNALRLEFSIWILNALLYVVYQVFIFIEWKKNFSVKSRNDG